MQNDLTFFTNEPGSTLLDRFKRTLRDVRFTDILVRYFCTSGFDKLNESFATIDKIRILVGLNVDRTAFEIIDAYQTQSTLDFHSHKRTKEIFSEEVTAEMDRSPDSFETEISALKFLYEHFQEDINIDEDFDTFLPEGFMDLDSQKQAVIAAKKILDAYNGVFLADVVGLGKTFISAMLAQQLRGKILVICPPVLKDYWEETFFDLGVRGYKTVKERK